MSVIIGIGLATIFREICKGKHCKLLVAPPIDEIDDKIYKFDDTCYRLVKQHVKCDNKKEIVRI